MLTLLLETVRDWVQTVLATFHSMYLGYSTPQMFGAKGDGVTDDTTAIKRCFETNGKVFIPKGTYLVRRGQDITLPDNLCIEGEGQDQTIIRFFFANSDRAHGMRFNANSNSFTLSNISLESVINGNDTAFIGSKDTVLMLFKGTINEMTLKNCRFTSTGNANVLPRDTLVWCFTSGTSLIIDGCLFENFTNNQMGGCFWHRSYDDFSLETKYTETIICRNSEFRNTNSDEAFGIWDGKENEHCGYHTIIVEDNTFIHKNWNGECYQTSQIADIASFIPNAPLSPIDARFAHNSFYVEKIFNTVIKLIGIEGAVCEGNSIHVASISTNTNGHSFIECRLAKATIKDNTFTSDIIDTYLDDRGNTKDKFVEITNQASDTLYINNRFILKSFPRMNITAATNRGKTDDPESAVRGANFCTLDGNVIEFEKINNALNLYIVKEDDENCTLIMKNNTTTAKSIFFSKIGTSRIELLNNIFSCRTNTLASFDLLQSGSFGAGATLKFENNRNTKLILRNPNVSKKLASFTYVGLKSGISIRSASDGNVEDYTASNITQYATSNVLTYTDGYGWPNDAIVGRVNIMPSAGQNRVGQIYLYSGTQSSFVRGQAYECRAVEGSSPVRYKWYPLIDNIQKVDSIPTASADNVGLTYLYTGATTSTYQKGGIYECQQTSNDTYEWKLTNLPVAVVKDIVANSADFEAFKSKIALL